MVNSPIVIMVACGLALTSWKVDGRTAPVVEPTDERTSGRVEPSGQTGRAGSCEADRASGRVG